ncbi:MAG: hypothetical protein SVR94_10465, partial [Pseudomonadota bacterium]|nr:hypothetical protein [Pseudomonadota bacterium]
MKAKYPISKPKVDNDVTILMPLLASERPQWAVDSTSSAKHCYPFWNARCGEITSNLWLPTETDWRDSELNLSNILANSWFSAQQLTLKKQNLPKTYSISFTSPHVECTDSDIIKSKYIKLYLTQKQRETFNY